MKTVTACLLMMAALLSSSHVRADDPQPIPLWKSDELTPKPDPAAATEKKIDRDIGRWVGGVTDPTIAILPAAADKGPRPAVIICPGGGYGGLALDWEGYDVAHWLNGIGVTGIVLKYRMPQPAVTKDGKPLPLLDAQRAIQMVRANAKEWNIDPNKIGIIGFSAGGHLASSTGTHFDPPNPEAADPIDRVSDRPDFMILVYPVITLTNPNGHGGSRQNLLGKTPDDNMVELYSNEKQVTDKTPPAFLTHAEDDPVKCENSLLFFEALREHKVPCELRLFATGGHGYGLGKKGGEPAAWPKECEAWLKRNHFLGHATTPDNR